MNILEVENLSVRYGAVEAVRGLSLRVAEGEAITLIGPNGAGKSSTLKGILGLVQASGTVRYLGKPLLQREPEVLAAMGLVMVPEKRELFASMAVEDNLLLGAFSRFQRREKGIRKDLEWVYSLFPRLLERRKQLAGTMSGGEQQMLAIGRALMARPRLLLLDEPSLGLAPLIVQEIFRILGELKAQRVTILVVEQNARMALKLADRGYVLEAGELVMEGRGSELLYDPRVIESYLGIRTREAAGG
ncbi:High-affinity branched-chain amino acid transport ATP-binding protein LivF [Meiothermus luteus]|jgi:branched-chain amino acid transport system ATP-binding protein|uniref:High-affinity branched-chain amino acid transport ATP-binding protein LivF n=1 Tax=Meiothermus luteus TaxID=2026184 RepID=A0A399ED12_9DEIN|nr:ABC transporter ATP-binding protein [Meiothermus luteus]RIH82527.1 High-affinity branched-chain amino acid transport ATP-binding protein LivF [Meiothermus luteus]RMH55220.1 MAG: ATP-binding cassette domain-containing protein [Deinococcota bacterium]